MGQQVPKRSAGDASGRPSPLRVMGIETEYGISALGDRGEEDLHPMQLSRFLEEAWAFRAPMPPLAAPTLLEVPGALIPQERTSGLAAALPVPVVWDHLIYAYMVENTRTYEIFRRVLEEYLHGETLAVPSDAGERWLRTTEQLLYHAAPAFQIYSTTSWIRPDARAARRNAYFRMLDRKSTRLNSSH